MGRSWSDRVPRRRGPVRHPRRRAYDVALVLVRGALRPGQRGVREPGGAQRRAAAPGHGLRQPPARRSRDRHLGAHRGSAAHLRSGVGRDRARSGAAPLRRPTASYMPRPQTVPTRHGSCRHGCVRTSRVSSRATSRPTSPSATSGPAWRATPASYPSLPEVRRCTWPTCQRASSAACPSPARLHVFVARGQVMLGERLLEPGDTARLLDEGGRPVTADTDSHLVVWSFRV